MIFTKDILSALKTAYRSVAIPDKTGQKIQQLFQLEVKKYQRQQRFKFWGKLTGTVLMTALVGILLIASIAPWRSAAAKVPIIGRIVRVLTGAEFQDKAPSFRIKLKVPKINSKSDAIHSLNQRYLADAQQKYQQVEKEIKQNKGEKLTVTSNYQKVVDDQRFLVIKRQTTETKADSATTVKYDVIDKKAQMVLSLPLLFKNQAYLTTISNEIQHQIKQQIAKSSNKIYWTKKDLAENEGVKGTILKAAHTFYLNHQHQLVIVFEQFAIAPGYMGNPKFVIPTKVIKKDLVNPNYLK
ncbi:RsiV family protein [Liquorilactobacillus vini]|uniref:DUF3298 domain-containing protein n=1 Tax=Liquorilactobacillus vini DSM 20605 TaxID=1133569 RepID=A0A0R2CAU6_9LACO|nr:RsiV family protein [Liquorilactobacillus vini]KRM88991.1 hypothetical protein FD21_GL000453 [Liquorilactobacillus vini DSM 20605]